MVSSAKMKAWIRPTNRSKVFQMAFGAHCTYQGNIAISATRICAFTLWALVPRNFLIRRCCFIALKKSSTFHRAL